MLIDSKISTGGELCHYAQDVIKNEPMFFNASSSYAWKNGGPITRDFLHVVGLNEFIPGECVFDSRVHMLMKGWYPCIPGFHHDDVPRSLNNQPNYVNPEYRSRHACALVNGSICPTEYAIGSSDFELPSEGIIYKIWHPQVVRKLGRNLKSWFAPDRTVIYFNDRTWHQGTRAVASGWRWFGRLSWDTNRTKNLTNEIRKQVQVYLEFPMEGW